MPATANLLPQTPPDEQVRVPHSESVPGQSAAFRHPTHCPVELHTSPMPQLAPAGPAGFDGTPLVQTSLVHGFLSSGTSRSSICDARAPLPSQLFVWQSPGTCAEVAVPAGK